MSAAIVFSERASTAVLVSGTGRSLLNLLELERRGALPTRITLVISSKAGVGALEHAAAFDVPARVCRPSEVSAALEEARSELVVMAGYLKRWPIPAHYRGRAINIHPALLPLFGGRGFYGHHVHEAVVNSGMRVSGCTVHYVTEDYDAGPIIAQAPVPVHPDDTADTLADRVFAQELTLLPRCIRDVISGRVRLEGNRVVHRP